MASRSTASNMWVSHATSETLDSVTRARTRHFWQLVFRGRIARRSKSSLSKNIPDRRVMQFWEGFSKIFQAVFSSHLKNEIAISEPTQWHKMKATPNTQRPSKTAVWFTPVQVVARCIVVHLGLHQPIYTFLYVDALNFLFLFSGGGDNVLIILPCTMFVRL